MGTGGPPPGRIARRADRCLGSSPRLPKRRNGRCRTSGRSGWPRWRRWRRCGSKTSGAGWSHTKSPPIGGCCRPRRRSFPPNMPPPLDWSRNAWRSAGAVAADWADAPWWNGRRSRRCRRGSAKPRQSARFAARPPPDGCDGLSRPRICCRRAGCPLARRRLGPTVRTPAFPLRHPVWTVRPTTHRLGRFRPRCPATPGSCPRSPAGRGGRRRQRPPHGSPASAHRPGASPRCAANPCRPRHRSGISCFPASRPDAPIGSLGCGSR